MRASAFTYAWNFGDGKTGSGSTPTISHAYASPGTYTATVTATDSVGETATATATVTVTVSADLQATITGLPSSGYSPEGAQLSLGSSVSGGVGADSYGWLVTLGGSTVASGSNSTLSFTPSSTGTYKVSLTVTDSASDTTSASGSVVVDLPPTASLGGPYSGQPGSAVAFTASASNPNTGEAAGFTYSWNFGDGKTDSGTSATDSHAYAAAGTYTVTVTATDSVGETATGTATVNVAAASGSAIMLDDGGPGGSGTGAGFSMAGAGWAGKNIGPAAWNGEIVYNAEAPIGGATATWQTNQVQPGVEYVVQATWQPSPAHCSAAPCNIYDDDTLVATVTVNQQMAPSGPTYNGVTFQTLTTIVPTTGTITVTVTNEAGGALVADAVRIALPGSPPTAQLQRSVVGARWHIQCHRVVLQPAGRNGTIHLQLRLRQHRHLRDRQQQQCDGNDSGVLPCQSQYDPGGPWPDSG